MFSRISDRLKTSLIVAPPLLAALWLIERCSG
jgi:hypothetical protein